MGWPGDMVFGGVSSLGCSQNFGMPKEMLASELSAG